MSTNLMTAVRLLGCLAVVVLLSGADAPKSGDIVIEDTLVEVQYVADIPAPVAGVLIEMQVKEGSQLKKGELMAVIDDREAAAALKIAKFGHEAAVKRSEDDIEERYAVMAARVAEIDWKQDIKANKDYPGAIPDIEVFQKELVYERSNLQIEKAKKDRELAVLDANTKQAELDAAQMAIDWRQIKSPVDGEVITTFLNQDEWVNPGDPILTFMRLDVLKVKGAVYADEHDREELLGRPVSVYVSKAHGREVLVKGTVVHADQMMTGTRGLYSVYAEIKNERDGNGWLIQPGMYARMVIHAK